MGIYDPVLQAYQHGVDQRIQLASQPITLAQSILQGYQQGFGNRMQQEHFGLQRDQFAEQQRRAQAQEAEARQWHRLQAGEAFTKNLNNAQFNTPEEWEATKRKADELGVPFNMPKPEQTEASVAAQSEWLKETARRKAEGPWGSPDASGSGYEMPGTPEAPMPEKPKEEYAPSYGPGLQHKYAETKRKEENSRITQELKSLVANGQLDRWAQQNKLNKEQADLIRFKIERGERFEDQELDYLRSKTQLNDRLPQDTFVFGGGGRVNSRGLSAFDSSVNNVLKQENDRRQKANENIINGKDLTTGKPAQPLPMLTRQEAEEMVKSGWKGLSETTADPDSGIGQDGGGPVLKPKPQAKPASGAAIKLKIKASKPVAKDGSGKEVWKVDGKFYYGDGTEYRPPAK